MSSENERPAFRADVGGITIGGKGYWVGYVPGRKKPALYRTQKGENVIHVAAYFQSHDEAARFLDWLVDDMAEVLIAAQERQRLLRAAQEGTA